MAKENRELLAFNRGVISPRGLARIDLERMAMSSDLQRNWMPRVLGSMMLRPGLEFIGRTYNDTVKARQMPFVFGVDDTAALEFTHVNMKVRIDDVLITRPAVSATITDPNFASPLGVGANDWQDASDAGGSAIITTGTARVWGDKNDFGIIRQTVVVTETGIEHAVKISIADGPVRLRIGSTVGDDDLVRETRLQAGWHHLGFTPDGDFTIEFANEREFQARVQNCNIEQNVDMLILTPYAEEDLPFLRMDQSGDVIYVACKNLTQTGVDIEAERLIKIERRGVGRSWSVSDYLPEDGPPYYGIFKTDGSWAYPTVTIKGYWGYSKAPPPDIELACLRLSKWLYDQRDTTTGSAAIVTPDGQVLLPQGLPSDVLTLLKPYKKVIVA